MAETVTLVLWFLLCLLLPFHLVKCLLLLLKGGRSFKKTWDVPQWFVHSSLSLPCPRDWHKLQLPGGRCVSCVPGSAYGFGPSQVVAIFGWHHAAHGLHTTCRCQAWLSLLLTSGLISFLIPLIPLILISFLIPLPLWRLEALSAFLVCTHTNEWPFPCLLSGCCDPTPPQSLREPLPAHWGEHNPKMALGSLAGFSSSRSVQGRHVIDREAGEYQN